MIGKTGNNLLRFILKNKTKTNIFGHVLIEIHNTVKAQTTIVDSGLSKDDYN